MSLVSGKGQGTGLRSPNWLQSGASARDGVTGPFAFPASACLNHAGGGMAAVAGGRRS